MREKPEENYLGAHKPATRFTGDGGGVEGRTSRASEVTLSRTYGTKDVTLACIAASMDSSLALGFA